MATQLDKQWYSNELVKDIITPNIDTWRSRYDLKEQLLLNDNNLVIRNMRANDMVPYKTSQDTIHIVTISEQYRPDVIANNAYGDSNLAWVILSANGLSDIFDLVAEMEIRIPSSLSIYNMGGVLNR